MSLRDKILTTISATSEKTANARDRKKAKGNATAFATIWSDAVIDEYGEENHVTPTIAGMSSLKRALARLAFSSHKDSAAFVEWSIRNWKLLGESQFAKLKTYPEFPALGFFVKSIETYYFSYCRKDRAGVVSRPHPKKLAVNSDEAKKIKELEAKLARAEGENKKLHSELDRRKRATRKGDIPSWD